MTPLGRVGQTDDIAPAAVFFASDDSKWITGETLLIARSVSAAERARQVSAITR